VRGGLPRRLIHFEQAPTDALHRSQRVHRLRRLQPGVPRQRDLPRVVVTACGRLHADQRTGSRKGRGRAAPRGNKPADLPCGRPGRQRLAPFTPSVRAAGSSGTSIAPPDAHRVAAPGGHPSSRPWSLTLPTRPRSGGGSPSCDGPRRTPCRPAAVRLPVVRPALAAAGRRRPRGRRPALPRLPGTSRREPVPALPPARGAGGAGGRGSAGWRIRSPRRIRPTRAWYLRRGPPRPRARLDAPADGAEAATRGWSASPCGRDRRAGAGVGLVVGAPRHKATSLLTRIGRAPRPRPRPLAGPRPGDHSMSASVAAPDRRSTP